MGVTLKIIWSALAVDQVRDIASYKPAVALKWADGIFDSVARLVEFPKSGRIVPELGRSEIREMVEGNYRVIYKVKEKELLVLVVKSYRQKLTPDNVSR